MPDIPRDKPFDSTLPFLLDPYSYISKRCRALETDLFRTRVLLQPTICMTGQDAAKLFYDPQRFIRHGAAPTRLQKTLFGEGGVQGLDDAEHRHRKQMFMDLMSPDRITELAAISAGQWRSSATRWSSMESVPLYEEAQQLLTRSVCTWAGVPLDGTEVDTRTGELAALFDDAGSVGPKHWWSRRARTRAERWCADLIERIRAGSLRAPEHTAANRIARHRDLDGKLLSLHDAAVELLNILRPTVAVSVYVVFTALALHCHPRCRKHVEAAQDGYAERFVQEVRRFYPFFPAVAAIVRHDFDWNGYHFAKGTRVLLDLYGVNHDPRSWQAPDEFRPDRFRTWDQSPYNFVPQGGGDFMANHRCAGEWITIELLKVAVRFLAHGITYDVPEQDLRIDRRRLPALPHSRFLMRNVRIARETDIDTSSFTQPSA